MVGGRGVIKKAAWTANGEKWACGIHRSIKITRIVQTKKGVAGRGLAPAGGRRKELRDALRCRPATNQILQGASAGETRAEVGCAPDAVGARRGRETDRRGAGDSRGGEGEVWGRRWRAGMGRGPCGTRSEVGPRHHIVARVEGRRRVEVDGDAEAGDAHGPLRAEALDGLEERPRGDRAELDLAGVEDAVAADDAPPVLERVHDWRRRRNVSVRTQHKQRERGTHR